MHDLLIRNGTLIDGSGSPGFAGDLAIEGGRIVAVGEVHGTARRTLDADGRLVTPGFIDPHTHLDAQLLWDPLATPTCWHGTTSVIVGNCGVGFAPVGAEDRELLAETLESVEQIPRESIMAGVDWEWQGFGGYLDVLEAKDIGVNVGALVGHVALRVSAMGEGCGDPERTASEKELGVLQEMVNEAIESGALGFSTSRTGAHCMPDGTPIPGTFAPDEELFALSRVLGDHGRGVVQWVAGFGEQDTTSEFPEACREVELMGEVSRRCGRPVIFSMFTHELVPALHGKVLATADAERAAGAQIWPMFNPRPVLSFVGLGNHSPVRASAWKRFYQRPPGERLAALEDPAVRRELLDVRPEVDARIGSEYTLFGPDECAYEIEEVPRLAEVAAERGQRPIETMVDLFRETGGRQIFASAGSNQVLAHIEDVFGHPGTLFGLGDAGAHVTGICDSSLTTYLLSHWCRERGFLVVEDAVRRLTSDPAEAFAIPGRGRLEVGFHADVNVIDFDALRIEVPEFVFDFPAGAGRWTQKSSGYDYTLVNGEVMVEGGQHTGNFAGQVIRGA
ncbi:MAG: amidohydrolase family protein [Myxococcota bacterium]|nr:amidohydrolase family protein [Myxococcota bacterium]